MQRHKSANKGKEVTDLTQSRIDTSGYYILKWLGVLAMALGLISSIAVSSKPVHNIMYCIGETAFPIFVFLLSESYHFTKNRVWHFLKIMIISYISEIPYDYITQGQLISFKKQNPCITLLLCYIVCIVINSDLKSKLKLFYKSEKLQKVMSKSLKLLMLTGIGIAAVSLNLQYDWYAILLISLLELSRRHSNVFTALSIAAYSLIAYQGSFLNCCAVLSAVPIMVMLKIGRHSKLNDNKSIPDSLLTSKASVYITRISYPIMLTAISLIRNSFLKLLVSIQG